MAGRRKETAQAPPKVSSGLMVPPHALEAEQSVLGGILLNGEALIEVADILKPEMFYRHDHRLIFRAMLKLDEKQRTTVDIITLSEALGHDDLEQVGGIQYLATLARETPGTANIASYARIIRARCTGRDMIELGHELAGIGYMGDGAEDLLGDVQQRILEIGAANQRTGPVPIGDVIPSYLDALSERFERKNPLVGIPTGFGQLDHLILGLEAGNVYVIGGRPSTGKTSLVLAIIDHVCVNDGRHTAMFSLEMSTSQLVDRMLARHSRVPLQTIRSGQLQNEDWDAIDDPMTKIVRAPLVVDETAGLAIDELRARARRIHHRKKLELIVVDYLQLMTARRAENRLNEVRLISAGLKALAKELSVPVIVLSQLNRESEKREDKKPQLSDLRESGNVEQDADMIGLLWRPPDHKDVVHLLVEKQRNGPTKEVLMYFGAEFATFTDMPPEERSAYWAEQREEKAPKRNTAGFPGAPSAYAGLSPSRQAELIEEGIKR